ncbi:MAG TPA: hypothetical protein VH592_16805 [Gemmataceae bacterium]
MVSAAMVQYSAPATLSLAPGDKSSAEESPARHGGKADTEATANPSTDPQRIGKKLSVLVGQPFLKGAFSYGREFMFHFGQPMPYSHPSLAGESKGTWILGTRASGWQLLAPFEGKLIEIGWPSELLSGATLAKWTRREEKDESVIEAAVNRLLAGACVMYVQLLPLVFGFGLTITFSNGASLLLCPNPEPDDDPEPLADWELFFTAQHRFLRCGPGRKCPYLRADIVEDEEVDDEEPS